jgi:hypothetical protein
MTIETWVSDKGNSEIHHFIEGTQTYLFGFNAKLLGYGNYADVIKIVTSKLKEMERELAIYEKN